jgi:hypothetical protein
MMLGPDGYSFAIATNDGPLDDELQGTNALQKKRPLHEKFDGTAGRQWLLRFEQDTGAADVQRAAQPEPLHSTFAK